VRGKLQTAHELAEQLLRLAQRVHDPALLVEAHSVLGATLFSLGEFASAREHAEQSLALYDAQQPHALVFLHEFDPRVFCLSRGPSSCGFLAIQTKP
jgi:tetratricopeptide (TPR) repeat protein